MRLTQNFTLQEFLKSDTAAALRIKNDPSPEHLNNLFQLAYALECLRAGAYANRAMIITSAYRNPEVNAAVGGTSTSAHPMGYAADYYVVGLPILQAAQQAVDFVNRTRLPYDQLIYEPTRGIVHLSVDPKYRRQVLTQVGGPGSRIVPGISGG